MGVGAGWQKQTQEQDGSDVEDGDPEDDGVDGFGDDLLRVSGLPRGGADELNSGVGEDNTLDDDECG